jgi:hypothetical protein
MKRIRLLPVLILGLVSTFAVADDSDQQWVVQSRLLTAELGTQLKAELTAAMAAGGPSAAIGVCSSRAQAIAAELSTDSGATVRRTALKLRNTANAPDQIEHLILRQFEQELASGAFEGPLEAAFEINRGGQKERRYMRAITTEGVCLTCHGTNLTPEVSSAIARVYPQDRATGFESGSLRGAFSVIWPVVPLGD